MRFRKNKLLISVIMVVVLTITTLSGCFFDLNVKDYSFEFKKNTLTLKVGEKKTISKSDFYFTPDYMSRDEFRLQSTDTSVLGITGQTIEGKSEGEVTLQATTIENKIARVKVKVTNVLEKAEIEVKEGELVQTLVGEAKAKPIKFCMKLNDGKLSSDKYNKEYEWEVNGKIQTNTTSEYDFDVYKVAIGKVYGEYKIACKIKSRNDIKIEPIIVKIYDDFTATATYIGELTQEENAYSKVKFSCEIDNKANIIKPTIEWKNNGELVSIEKDYVFKPEKAGTYNIELYINGVKQKIQECDSIKILAKGKSPAPTELYFDYDTNYLKPTLYWYDEIGSFNYEVEITDLLTREVSTYEVTDNMFLETELPLTKNDYKFRVKTISSGIFKDSEYSEPLIFKKIPAFLTNSYLRNDWLEGENGQYYKNRHIIDDDEFYEYYDHLFISRPQVIDEEKGTKVEEDIYMAYDYTNDGVRTLQGLMQETFDILGYTGLYETGINEKPNDVVHIVINFKTGNIPTIGNSYDSENNLSNQLNAIRPSFSKTGKADNFPIDEWERVKVETTEELYRMAEQWYCPVPKPGSKAEEVNNYARAVLMSITDDTMSDYEKALAIYDWVMNKVLYDIKASQESDIVSSVKNSAYYLEGVFNDEASLAVCDGISKAYSLLCNISGISCVRVAGEAGKGGQRGGHAWNMVVIDEKCYIVDCTWGDARININIGKGNKTYEIASHRYFMTTYNEMGGTHIANKIDEGILMAEEGINYYDYVDLGNGADLYIGSANCQQEVSEIAKYIYEKTPKGKEKFPGYGLSNESEQFGLEIKVSDPSIINSVKRELEKSLGKQGGIFNRSFHYNVFTSVDNEYIMVIAENK